jgi:hypothetical protein
MFAAYFTAFVDRAQDVFTVFLLSVDLTMPGAATQRVCIKFCEKIGETVTANKELIWRCNKGQ